MEQQLQRYIGQVVEMIVLDKDERTIYKLVEVNQVERDKVRVYCFKQKAPRVFKIKTILVAVPVIGMKRTEKKSQKFAKKLLQKDEIS